MTKVKLWLNRNVRYVTVSMKCGSQISTSLDGKSWWNLRAPRERISRMRKIPIIVNDLVKTYSQDPDAHTKKLVEGSCGSCTAWTSWRRRRRPRTNGPPSCGT